MYFFKGLCERFYNLFLDDGSNLWRTQELPIPKHCHMDKNYKEEVQRAVNEALREMADSLRLQGSTA